MPNNKEIKENIIDQIRSLPILNIGSASDGPLEQMRKGLEWSDAHPDSKPHFLVMDNKKRILVTY